MAGLIAQRRQFCPEECCDFFRKFNQSIYVKLLNT